jgi:hypothetical protein
VKNITIGRRGLYADRESVTDVANLNWYVGEIYVTDTDIRPDTKRSIFQPSERHDEVIAALRRFYRSTALRARGWSDQVVAQDKAEQARTLAAEVRDVIDQVSRDAGDDPLSGGAMQGELAEKWAAIERLERDLIAANETANKADSELDSEATIIARSYLRKDEVVSAVTQALGSIRTLREFLQGKGLVGPGKGSAVRATATRRSRSGARSLPTRLKGDPVTPEAALGQQVRTGTGTEADEAASQPRPADQMVSLNTVVDAFTAAVASVLGDQSEGFSRIMQRLTDELRRRGYSA